MLNPKISRDKGTNVEGVDVIQISREDLTRVAARFWGINRPPSLAEHAWDPSSLAHLLDIFNTLIWNTQPVWKGLKHEEESIVNP